MTAHETAEDGEIFVDFFDNNGGPINETDLFGIISQKMNCGCFYVELKISGEVDKSITVEVGYDSLRFDFVNFSKIVSRIAAIAEFSYPKWQPDCTKRARANEHTDKKKPHEANQLLVSTN